MLSVNQWTWSLEQQQSKGLDTPPEVRLAGNLVEATLRLGQPNQLGDSIKWITTYNKYFLITAPLLEGESGSTTATICPAPITQDAYPPFYTFTLVPWWDTSQWNSWGYLPVNRSSTHLTTDRISPTPLPTAPQQSSNAHHKHYLVSDFHLLTCTATATSTCPETADNHPWRPC